MIFIPVALCARSHEIFLCSVDILDLLFSPIASHSAFIKHILDFLLSLPFLGCFAECLLFLQRKKIIVIK